MAVFYDTHAHLDYPELAREVPAILERARDAGITRIVTIGTNLESSRRAVELAARHEEIFAAVGWHPGEALEAPDDIVPAFRELARHPKVVAIGETGLDFYRLPSQQPGGTPEDDERYRARQAALFEQHLSLAAELGLNVVLHQRDSLDAVLAQFEPFAQRVRAVFHCFVGDQAALRRILDLGSLVSFTGIVTFKNAQNVRDALAATPEDRFMLETDSPYLAPVPHRGKRCEPAHVADTAAVVAQVRNCPLDALSAATCATADRFFRWSTRA
jgi:TatD DNase family protein